jgi:hypothetical protein
MLPDLNRRLEGLSHSKLRMYQDSGGSIWLQDLHSASPCEPVNLGSLSDAIKFVEDMEREERMVAVMS